MIIEGNPVIWLLGTSPQMPPLGWNRMEKEIEEDDGGRRYLLEVYRTLVP